MSFWFFFATVNLLYCCRRGPRADSKRELWVCTRARKRLPRPPLLFSLRGVWSSTSGAKVKNPAHDKLGLKRRRSSSSAAAAAGVFVAGVPVASPGAPNSVAGKRPPSPSAAASVGTMKWKYDIKRRVSRKGGLTRGQRLALSHRHYDIRAAVEVLRRSPLPETAVWRKMRQIVGARFVEPVPLAVPLTVPLTVPLVLLFFLVSDVRT